MIIWGKAYLVLILREFRIHDAERKVFLILDNLRVHHAKKVTAWLEKHKDEIELLF